MSQLADVEFLAEGGCVVARLSGEVDQANADLLAGALTDALSNQALALVLDLTAVAYFDSAGIRLVYELRARLRTRGQDLRLVIPTGSAAHTALRLAGVTEHIPTFESASEARTDRTQD